MRAERRFAPGATPRLLCHRSSVDGVGHARAHASGLPALPASRNLPQRQSQSERRAKSVPPPRRPPTPATPPRGGLTLVMSGDDDGENESHKLRMTAIQPVQRRTSRLAARRSHRRTRPSFRAQPFCSFQSCFAMACSTWAGGSARAFGSGASSRRSGRPSTCSSHSSPSPGLVPVSAPVPGSSPAARCLVQNGRDTGS